MVSGDNPDLGEIILTKCSLSIPFIISVPCLFPWFCSLVTLISDVVALHYPAGKSRNGSANQELSGATSATRQLPIGSARGTSVASAVSLELQTLTPVLKTRELKPITRQSVRCSCTESPCFLNF
jgi:hypothetical protein